MQPRVSQRSRFIAKSLLVLIAALILVGMAYEQIAKRVDRKKFSQVSRSVDNCGRSLNIYCSREGGQAVILDTADQLLGARIPCCKSKLRSSRRHAGSIERGWARTPVEQARP
jgi:hypothetical protein